jgi:penicillin-binding protein 2
MLRRGKRTTKDKELSPDEIFLDASNLPDFDRSRLEGRLERPIGSTSYFWLTAAVAILLFGYAVQAANLQLIQGESYAKRSEQNRLRPEILFANRGAILDRNGELLVKNEMREEGFVGRAYASPGFSHVLGYVSYPKKDSSGNYYDTEVVGLAGVEEAFNSELSGTNGLLLIEENALGDVQSKGSVQAPRDGETITLSLDAKAQRAFYNAISELAERVPYQGGAGVLIDVETGEVHALVSYPEYNSNVLSTGAPRDTIASYQKDSRGPFLNRPVSGLYTPGSIVKPMIAAGALFDGIISPEKEIVSTGALTVPNPYNPDLPTVFRDWKAHGATDMREAIAVSSDVYFYTVGGGFKEQKGLGIERLAFWYRAFGFESPTNIELTGEETGFIPTPLWKEEVFGEPWRIGNTYHTAIGQYSMQITVLEAVRAVAAIANGGRLPNLTLKKDNRAGGETVLISSEALAVARDGMREGVTHGTSVGLNLYSYANAAGKTGTAELGFNNEYRNSWSVGFFPYDTPRYAWAVVMEKGPEGNAVGGIYVMARVFEELRQTAPYYFGIEE